MDCTRLALPLAALLVAALVFSGCSLRGRQDGAATPPAQASQALERGHRAAEHGRWEDAAQSYALAAALNQASPTAHFHHAVALARLGRTDEALVGLRQALLLEPAMPEALHNLGTLLLARRDLAPAAAALEDSLRLDPSNAAAWNNLGKAYYLLGLPELAAAAFESALEADPRHEPARQNLALVAGATRARASLDMTATPGSP
jgi:superkiller protein 3